MYSSYDEAARILVEELDRFVNLPLLRRAYLRNVLARTLRADTNNTLTRTDYLSKDRFSRAIQNKPDEQAALVNIKTLFPQTWEVVEKCLQYTATET